MKTKASNLPRLVVLVLIAVILISTVAYAADAKADGEKADHNTDNTQQTGAVEQEAPLPTKTTYRTFLLGEETDTVDTAKPVSVLVGADTSVLGISSADIVTELPLEGGESRFLLTFSNADGIGKIGAVAPTRKYMTNVAGYLSSVFVYRGSDATVADTGYDVADTLDLSRVSGASYSEYGTNAYTNGLLLRSARERLGISEERDADATLPFRFGTGTPPSGTRAGSVSVSYGGAETVLRYDATLGTYALEKSGVPVTDPLSGAGASYRNVFLLFADAVTYETAERTETVLDTKGGGIGYYLTGGQLLKFRWSTDAAGGMTFTDTKGNLLEAASGRSYIAFAKSSMISEVRIG